MELLPCPFCGSTLFLTSRADFSQIWNHKNNDCILAGRELSADNYFKEIDRWNTRTNAPD